MNLKENLVVNYVDLIYEMIKVGIKVVKNYI